VEVIRNTGTVAYWHKAEIRILVNSMWK